MTGLLRNDVPRHETSLPATLPDALAHLCQPGTRRQPANSKLNDIYASRVLVRKVWRKLLRAAALEAIGERTAKPVERLRDIAEVSAWLEEAAAAEDENLPPRTQLSTRRARAQLRFETRDTVVAEPIHLSILTH